jgi:hypothetical protein
MFPALWEADLNQAWAAEGAASEPGRQGEKAVAQCLPNTLEQVKMWVSVRPETYLYSP